MDTPNFDFLEYADLQGVDFAALSQATESKFASDKTKLQKLLSTIVQEDGVELFQLLKTKGLDMKALDDNNEGELYFSMSSVLEVCLKNNAHKCLRFLVDEQVRVDKVDTQSGANLFLTSLKESAYTCAALLMSTGIDTTVWDRQHRNALYYIMEQVAHSKEHQYVPTAFQSSPGARYYAKKPELTTIMFERVFRQIEKQLQRPKKLTDVILQSLGEKPPSFYGVKYEKTLQDYFFTKTLSGYSTLSIMAYHNEKFKAPENNPYKTWTTFAFSLFTELEDIKMFSLQLQNYTNLLKGLESSNPSIPSIEKDNRTISIIKEKKVFTQSLSALPPPQATDSKINKI